MCRVNDFSFYDHVLDTIALLGAVPERYKFSGENVDVDTYFAMARGGRTGKLKDVPAMEMTKWLDTNYHYIVPELHKGQKFKLASTKIFDEFDEAKALGIKARPVLLGPVSFLLLAKERDGGNLLDLLDGILPVYKNILAKLKTLGAEWIQLDEPALVLDLDAKKREAFKAAYAALVSADAPKILVATYFDSLGDNLDTALNLGVAALHIDAVRGEKSLDDAINKAPKDLILSIGVVEGRNIWKTDFEKALAKLEKAVAKLGKERVFIAPSCSLLHSPVDLDSETQLDAELKNWLAFAKQKVVEISVLAKAVNEGRDSVKAELAENKKAMQSRATSKRIHDDKVKSRVGSIDAKMAERKSAYPERIKLQETELNLPLFPTTTIGSFPQTEDVRAARAANKAGHMDDAGLQKVFAGKNYGMY